MYVVLGVGIVVALLALIAEIYWKRTGNKVRAMTRRSVYKFYLLYKKVKSKIKLKESKYFSGNMKFAETTKGSRSCNRELNIHLYNSKSLFPNKAILYCV